MARIRWHEDAQAQFLEIISYIEQDNAAAAAAFAQRVDQVVERLDPFPMSGRVVPEFGEERLREVIVVGYRVVYEVMALDEVAVLAVVHGARDFRNEDLPHD